MLHHRFLISAGLVLGFSAGWPCQVPAADRKAKATANQEELKPVIKKFFEENGFGYKDVKVTSLSEPMDVPKSYVLGQVIPMKAYSVSFKTETAFGKATMENWLLLITKRQGKPAVQGYFSSEDQIKSAFGKEGKDWYEKNHVKAPDVKREK